MKKKIKLGQKYRDPITGFVGTATARHEYQYGCVRVTLEGNADGKPDEYTFDEQRLESADRGEPVKLTATSGGARPKSPRRGLR